MNAARPVSAQSECEALVRAGDYDRWLATLFAPADKRPHLIALLAFNLEIARVRELIREPRLGEIRLQWWREALQGEREEALAHPVAAALIGTRERFHLPLAPFLELIEARTFDLWNDPAPSLAWLEGYCGETASSLFRLASLILADGEDPGGADAAGHAGVAFAFTGLLRALPWHSAAGQIYVPSDVLERNGVDPSVFLTRQSTPALREALGEMREHVRMHLAQTARELSSVAPVARPVFAALALVGPYLRRMERRDYEPFKTSVDLPSWRKVATMWASRAWRGG